MKPLDRRIAAKSGLRSVPVKRIAAKLLGDPAHINPKEDKLLRRLLPGSHGRVLRKGPLAEAGRLGDDRLTLVNAREAKLLKRRGGSGARNPKTGLREYEDDDDDSSPSDSSPSDGGSLSGSEGRDSFSGGPGNDTFGGGDNDGGGFHPENNPEMGGGRARGRGLASVDALGATGRDVNKASSVMAGLDPSWGDRAKDFVGWGAPGGLPGSRAANMGATMLGGMIGGPFGAAAASVAHNVGLGGRSLADTAPAAVGGLVAGGLGSLAGRTISDAVQGKVSYDAPMTENDRARKDAALDAQAAGIPSNTPGVSGGPNTGAETGAGAGTDYVMAPPEAAAPPTVTAAAAPTDGWDEVGFLTRNPEVAAAVKNGTWTSGRSFNEAYRAQAGSHYDSAKALGLIRPSYRDDMLAAAPGQAVPYRG